MSKKLDALRRIDVALGSVSGGGEVLSTTGSTLIPARPAPGAPEALTLISNTIGRSSASPIARVVVQWRAPNGAPADSYLVEVGTDSTFATILLRSTATEASVPYGLDLQPATAVAIRVYANAGQGQSPPSAVLTLTTASDTSAAGSPTSAAGAFIGSGDLRVTWVNPTTENFRDVEIKVWDSSSKGTLYTTEYDATGTWLWTAAQNRAAGSGTPDVSVYVELRSRTWALVLGTAVVVGTVTKSAPASPTGLAGDFTGTDCIITWSPVTDAAFYRLTIDGGTAKVIYGTRWIYTFDQNRVDHSGTPDPVLSLSLVAVDGLDQASSAATATATNAAPAAPTSVTVSGGFSAFMASVVATEPADFATYRYRLIQTSPTAADVTWDSPSALQTRDVGTSATYQVGVKMVDVFGQAGTETLSSTTVLDALSLADLRTDLTYSDSDANTFTPPASGTLAALKDNVVGSGGVTYAA